VFASGISVPDMPVKRAILIFLEVWHLDSSCTTRHPLESALCFSSLNLGEGATLVEINEYFLLRNWFESLFHVPVGHWLCLVLQLNDSLQD